MIPESDDYPRSHRPLHLDGNYDSSRGQSLRHSNADSNRLTSGRLKERDSHKEKNVVSSHGRSKTPSKSPPIKVWDPIQAEQDKLVRKQEREVEYTMAHPSEEPMLLVHKRELTTKYVRPEEEVEDQPASRVIKMSENTRIADEDYESMKQKMRLGILNSE